MNGLIESLLAAAAAAAPSGDNTQPWRFVLGTDTIALELEPDRDRSPMNAGQRMARIAVGAALENLLRGARDLGLNAELAAEPGPYLAVVHLRSEGAITGRLEPGFGARTTNRRLYDRRPIPPETLDRLIRETPDLHGIHTHWVVGTDQLQALARTIGRADGLMFGERTMRRAFLDNVRFDRPHAEAVAEGLSLASLELSPADRLALRVMRRTPDPVLKLGRASAVFRAKGQGLVASASGLCVVTAPDDLEPTDLAVGRAAQRAWLALTAAGLVAQPMMSLPVLENVLTQGSDDVRRALGHARVSALLEEFGSLVPELAGRRPAWVMRFGFAPPPSGAPAGSPWPASRRTRARLWRGRHE